MAVKPPKQVPYDQKGNMLNKIGWSRDGTIMVDNDPFETEMDFEQLGQTYSGTALVTLKTPDGREFPMYGKDFNEVMKVAQIDRGRISSLKYQARKVGSSYGLMLVE